MEIQTYRLGKVKEGAFICVKHRLHKGDRYLNIKWFEKILTDQLSAATLKLLTIFVAYVEGKPVGCGIVYPWVVSRNQDIRLLSVYVCPKNRKNKIGSALLKRMQDQGYSFKTRLVYNTDNRVGALFYKKHYIEALKAND